MRLGWYQTISGLLVFFLCCSIAPVCLEAAPPPDTFYVSPFGVDGEFRNGSETQPWRHIGYALSRAKVGSGDILIVQNDGIEETDDYVENVTVSKSVAIRGAWSGGSIPRVKAAWANFDVFEVTANSVEIRNLDIYGATSGSVAAIHLNGVGHCFIFRTYCGLSPTKRNANGILVSQGYQNRIMGNVNMHNSTAGISIWEASGNVFQGNFVLDNENGILLVQSGSANLLTENWIRYNVDRGIGFGATTRENVIARNFIEGNGNGIDLDGEADGLFVGNELWYNTVGLLVPAFAASNILFRNSFEDNVTQVSSATADYVLGSSVPIFYKYGIRYFKRNIGNFYEDYTGTDGNGDGIGDTAYSGVGYKDGQPLLSSTGVDLHAWSLAQQGSVGTLHRDSVENSGRVVTLPALSQKVFSETVARPETWFYRGGSVSEKTTWNGWLTFASPLPAGHTVEITPGVSDQSGLNFQPLGPVAVVTGDGTRFIHHFVAEPGTFRVPEGKRLAARLANTGAVDVQIMVGGAAGMIVAPLDSRPAAHWIPIMFLLLE